ncbi:MAG: hypothetical protein LBJ70_04795 [Holosporales bacterium]|nr:hypothetical protein [Holosporales bacterium]
MEEARELPVAALEEAAAEEPEFLTKALKEESLEWGEGLELPAEELADGIEETAPELEE